jgi:hypothetical protein
MATVGEGWFCDAAAMRSHALRNAARMRERGRGERATLQDRLREINVEQIVASKIRLPRWATECVGTFKLVTAART